MWKCPFHLDNMTAQVKDIVEVIEQIAPPRLAEEWDNCGLQIGDPDEEVSKLFVCLDLDAATLDEALDLGAEMVLTHHPLVFSPVKRITANETPVLYRAIRQGLAVYSAHTSYDSVVGGVSDVLAAAIGARVEGPLQEVAGQDSGVGIGRLCRFDIPLTREEYFSRIKTALGVQTLKTAGAGQGPVRRIAICAGSGGSLLPRALDEGVDSYLTGDLKYSLVRELAEERIIIVDGGHFSTESIAMPALAEKLGELLDRTGLKVQIEVTAREKDPFHRE